MKNLNIDSIKFSFGTKFIKYGLHVGVGAAYSKQSLKPFLLGYNKNVFLYNPNISAFYLRRCIQILSKILLCKRKILFVGAPLGFEKEFSALCLRNRHYILEKETPGIVTNFQTITNFSSKKIFLLSSRPSLVFIFSLSSKSTILPELSKMDIPVMGFLDSSFSQHLDFPLPLNTKSLRGGEFLYNLFWHLFLFNSKIKNNN